MAKSPPLEAQLRTHFAAARNQRSQASDSGLTASDRLAVRQWQQSRLATTHADLLESPQYGPAAHFFLTELYSTDDLTQRDADIERVIKILVKFLPDKALGTLATALEMDALSESLDAQLASHLRLAAGHNRPLKISASTYARAYRDMNQYTQRERQIVLTRQIGTALDKLAKMPFLLALLRMMRGPALAGGVGSLHEFLERGYAAFAHMKGGEEFIRLIVERELMEHRRLIGTEQQPA